MNEIKEVLVFLTHYAVKELKELEGEEGRQRLADFTEVDPDWMDAVPGELKRVVECQRGKDMRVEIVS